MKTAKELELSLLIKENKIQNLKLTIMFLEQRINKAIEKTLYLISEGNEWHWDNGALEDYTEDILKTLKGEDDEI